MHRTEHDRFPAPFLLVLGLCALLVLPLAACGGGEQAGDAAASGEAAATDNGEPAVASIDRPAGDDAGALAAGDAVSVSVDTEGAEAGTAIEIVWYGPEGLEAAVVEGVVEAGSAQQAFSTDTSGWAAGTYRAEVWVGNELVDELSIEVGASA